MDERRAFQGLPFRRLQELELLTFEADELGDFIGKVRSFSRNSLGLRLASALSLSIKGYSPVRVFEAPARM